MTLRMQLLSDPVGLKGGSLFTVTKRFLSNVSEFVKKFKYHGKKCGYV